MGRPRESIQITKGVPAQYRHIEPLRPKRQRRRPKVAPLTRERVFARDRYRCCQCGTEANLTIDHRKPLAKGGSNRYENLQTLCHTCNHLKADR